MLRLAAVALALLPFAGCIQPLQEGAGGAFAGSDADTGRVALQGHPGRFTAGAAWTFEARGAADLQWSLHRQLPGGSVGPLLASGQGASFPVRMESPGAYLLRAAEVAEGRTLRQAASAFLVDQNLTLEVVCRPGASVILVAEDPSICPGLKVPLPPGFFRLDISVSWPPGHDLAPCPYLAILEGGKPVFETYAWLTSERDGRLDMVYGVLSPEPTDLEVRWVPSLSNPLPVSYSVRVTALAHGGVGGSGGNGC